MGAGGGAGKRRNGHVALPLAALLGAKKLIEEAGSIEAARQTLDVLAKLL
jgi:hypothetical protein